MIQGGISASIWSALLVLDNLYYVSFLLAFLAF